MATVKDIVDISTSQGRTCMYSTEELETFPQEKLDAIFAGITVLANRGPWRKEKKGPPALKPGRKKKAKKKT